MTFMMASTAIRRAPMKSDHISGLANRRQQPTKPGEVQRRTRDPCALVVTRGSDAKLCDANAPNAYHRFARHLGQAAIVVGEQRTQLRQCLRAAKLTQRFDADSTERGRMARSGMGADGADIAVPSHLAKGNSSGPTDIRGQVIREELSQFGRS